MNLKSPVTLSDNTRLVESFSSQIIINAYKTDLDVDVSGFFKGIDKVEVRECLDTGYRFYWPFNILGNEPFYDELKIQLPAKYNAPYYSDWKWEYDICLNYIKKTDIVYEIGCGAGNFLLKLKENGSQVYGTELNYDSVVAATQKGLIVEFITIQQKADTTTEKYDVVCSFQVLEHVAEVKSFLDASIKILKKGGKLMIAVPYNAPYLFKNDKFNTLNMPPHHMGLWGKQAFKSLSKFFPIELEEIIIEKLPKCGYDFDQYYRINKDKNYPVGMPLKKIYDKFYLMWLKKKHTEKDGKNIIAIFKKNS